MPNLRPWLLAALLPAVQFAYADDEEMESEDSAEASYSEVSPVKSNSIELEFQVKDAKLAGQKIDSILQSLGAIVLHREEGNSYKWASTQTVIAKIGLNQISAIESQLSGLGERLSRQYQAGDVNQALADLTLERSTTQKKLDTYNAELSRYKAMDDERYQNLWDAVRGFESTIQEIDKNIATIKANADRAEATISIKEERITPAGNDKEDVKFVNMPGGEYVFLAVENDKAGLSSKYYQGYGLKYVFTKGKTNVAITTLKSDGGTSDSSTVSEIFLYSFGQDFYPIRKNTEGISFFNLYTGYDLGGMLASTETESHNHWFADVNIGLELFKSSRALLDARGSYFLPFYENRNLRGIMGRISLNIVF